MSLIDEQFEKALVAVQDDLGEACTIKPATHGRGLDVTSWYFIGPELDRFRSHGFSLHTIRQGQRDLVYISFVWTGKK